MPNKTAGETATIVAETASHEFAPWQREVGLTPDKLIVHAPRHIRNATIALQMLYLTKSQLVAEASDLSFLDAVEAVTQSADALEEVASIMKAAAARMLVAAATELQRTA